MRRGLNKKHFVITIVMAIILSVCPAFAKEVDMADVNISSDSKYQAEAIEDIVSEALTIGAAYGASTLSANGEKFIKEHEGLVLSAYNDGYGTLTIGWGHTANVTGSMTITEAQAQAYFDEDVAKKQKLVVDFATANNIAFTQQQFDALVSMVFNLKTNPLADPTCRLIKAIKKYQNGTSVNIPTNEVWECFATWHHVGKIDSKGLYNRRMDEARLFALGDYTRSTNWKTPSWLKDGAAGQEVPDGWVPEEYSTGVETCTCSEAYAGTYTVTTNSAALNIRSGHGSSFSSLGTMPKGATVTVTKASGTSASDWAHVVYNGISGYASMEYLTKQVTEVRGTEMTTGGSQVIPDGDYIIVAAAAGDESCRYYLDIDGADVPAASGTNVHLWTGAQAAISACDCWHLSYSDGFYTITQMGTGMSLDVTDGDTLRGKNIRVWEENGSSAQKWVISWNGRNGYIIQAKCSGYCLDIQDIKFEAGININQWENNGTDAQAWSFISLDKTVPVIRDVTITDVSKSGYTVSCTVTDDCGVDRVQFPTWTTANNQDDLMANWNTEAAASGTRNGDTYTYRVNVSDHNNEYGEYTTHIYAFDVNGNSSSSGCIVNVPALDINNFSWIPQRVYNIKPLHAPAQGLNIAGDSNDIGANIQLWNVEGNMYSRFFIRHVSNGWYEIISIVSGKVLEVQDFGGSGANVQTHNADKGSAKLWRFIQDADGSYYLVPQCAQYCAMDCTDGKWDNGTNIRIWEQNLSYAQKFTLDEQPAANVGDDFWALILNTSSWKPVAEAEDGNVELASEGGDNYERELWHFVRLSDGTYNIYSAYSGKCLHVVAGADEDGANIICHTWQSESYAPQKWNIITKGDNQYYFMPSEVSRTRVLDVKDGLSDDGTNLQLCGLWCGSPQVFSLHVLGPSNQADYSISAEATELDPGASTTVTVKGTGYINSYKLHIIAPDGKETVLDNKGKQTFEFMAEAAGTYTLYAEVASPVSSSKGSATDRSIQIKVKGAEVEPVAGARITLSSATASAGEEVSIPVTLTECPGVVSVEFSVQYDASVLEWTSVLEGEYGGSFDGEAGSMITWYAVDPSVNETKDGILATLVFRVKDDAPEGQTMVSITYEEDSVYNADEVNVAMAVTPGVITVSSYIPGDINGDGKVNNKDVTRLMRYTKYKDVEVVEAALDVNGDGKVNNKDVTRLMRYVKYKDVEIH